MLLQAMNSGQGRLDFRAPFDEPLYHALNAPKPEWLDAFFVFITGPSFGTAAALCVLLYLVGSLRKHAVRPVLQAAAVWVLVDRVGHQVIKPLIGRVRPCYALPKGSFRQLVEVANSGSMPSLHSANSFAVAMSITLVWPQAGRVLFPVATLIALSRVVVGVHWPSDVLAGAVFGCLVALAVHAAVQAVLRRAQPKPAEPATPAAPSDR